MVYCRKCGGTIWKQKMFNSVCVRCDTALPYRIKDVLDAELIDPPKVNTRGLDLIKEALDGRSVSN